MPEQKTKSQDLEYMIREYFAGKQFYKTLKESSFANAGARSGLAKKISDATGKTIILAGAPVDTVEQAAVGYDQYNTKNIVEYTKANLNKVLNDNPSEFLLQYAIANTLPSKENKTKYKEVAKLHEEVAEMGEILQKKDYGQMKKDLIEGISDPVLKEVYTYYANTYTEGVVMGYQTDYQIKMATLQGKFMSQNKKINRDMTQSYLLGNLTKDEEKNAFYLDAAINSVGEKEAKAKRAKKK